MRSDNFKFVIASMVIIALATIGLMTFGVTTDRFGGAGRSHDYSCVILDDPIASQTSLDLQCAHVIPQNATLVGFQVLCVTETSTAKTFDVMEGVGGAGVVTATLEYDAGALTPFDTFRKSVV